jgi:hypothetical protein
MKTQTDNSVEVLHLKTQMPGTKPGHDKSIYDGAGVYAVAISGKTASILVFSVAALNGLTM